MFQPSHDTQSNPRRSRRLVTTYVQYPDGCLIDRNRPRTHQVDPKDLDAATRVLPATDVVFCPALIHRTTRDAQSLYVSSISFLYTVDVHDKFALFFFVVLLLALKST
jgi:hypothetical protein